MDKNKKGLIILKLNLERVVIILLVCICGYLVHINNELKQSNQSLYNMIEYQKEEIKELNSVIKKSTNDLEEMNKELEQLLQKNLVIAEVEEIKYAEAEHKEIEKHLGEEQNVVEEPVVYSGGYTMTCRVTHYSSEETGSNVTASGEIAQLNHTIACNTLPFGTQVRINGIVYTVEDTGDMDGNGIDIYVSSSAEAFERGTYVTEVEVL